MTERLAPYISNPLSPSKPLAMSNFDPKGLAGKLKPQLQLIPPIINAQMAGVLVLGAKKYEPWNWRTNKVEIMTYIGAIRRHIDAVLDGQDTDPESGFDHLGHIAANCAIVLDARLNGDLLDNRPPSIFTRKPNLPPSSRSDASEAPKPHLEPERPKTRQIDRKSKVRLFGR